MKILHRISNYLKHISFCFRTTPPRSYLRMSRVAGAYLGLHAGLVKPGNKVIQIRFDEFDMDLNIYSREVAGYWEIFQEHQYLDIGRADKGKKVVVLDIGANVGFFAIRQALRHRENLRLIAFEPDPATYSRLVRNVSRVKDKAGSEITFYNCAIDTHTGHAKFLQNMSVESRVLDDESTDPSITVEITTLDSIIEKEGISKVDLMKIDVEGHELKVLEGGKKALAMTENITLEYHAPHFVEAIAAILAPYRFHLVNHNRDKAILSYSKEVPRARQAFTNTAEDSERTALA
jgi:FkbM family methyltransferase